MKKQNKTGRYSIYLKNADPRILEFCHAQSNFADAIRYLIEKEITANGIRNFQEFLPPTRHLPEIHKEKSIEDVIEQYKDVIEKAGQLGYFIEKNRLGYRVTKYNLKTQYWNELYESTTRIKDGIGLENYIKENMV